jgi:hypothetical protein
MELSAPGFVRNGRKRPFKMPEIPPFEWNDLKALSKEEIPHFVRNDT